MLLLGMFLFFETCAFAAETQNATAVFEKPSYASHQIQMVPANTKVEVTGDELRANGLTWVPVKIAGRNAWAVKDDLSLMKSDYGFEAWKGKENGFWLSVSGGPNILYSDKLHHGARIAIGAEWYPGPIKRFFIGTLISNQLTDESFSSDYSGKVIRYNTYLSVGYLLLPDKVYTRFGLGLSPFAGANRHFSRKFGASALAELGYHFDIADQHKAGVSFSFEYTGNARQSVSFLQDVQHCILGGCDPSSTPLVPAVVFALNFSYWFSP